MPISRAPSLALVALVLATACKKEPVADAGKEPAADADKSTAAPAGTAPAGAKIPDEPLAKLRTGAWPPKPLTARTGTITRHSRTDDAEYLEIELASAAGESGNAARAELDGLDDAIVVVADGDGTTRLLVRRPQPGDTAGPLAGSVWWSGVGGEYDRFGVSKLTASGSPKEDAELARAFADAFSNDLRDASGSWWIRGGSPFHRFAAGRIYSALLGKDDAQRIAAAPDRWRPTNDLSELMYTTTAAISLQEALQYERGLGASTGPEDDRNVPIAELAPPGLADHPFAEMRKALPADPAPASEPLAAATPAEFWYVRFDDIRQMLRVMDEADAWITPIAHVFDERPLVRDLADRYQRELALGRTELAKTLGNAAVSRLAVVGSDPYLRDGSDVTIVFDVASQTLLDRELAGHLDDWRGKVPGITTRDISYQGHTISLAADPAGLVHRYRVQVGELTIVSNSENACERVLDAIDGRRPRLSDQPDLQYMLARDPGEHDAFAFLGDRFVAEVVGPGQKVQQERRMRALTELSTPGYAALLFGWLHGRPPKDTAEMIGGGVLSATELEHTGGGEIAFTPGDTARSRWGRVDALTPLIDLPVVDKVSAAERDAYQGFARGYQDYWRQYIDPIAVRLDLDGDKATLDVRVLPLITGTTYRDYEEVVGEQRIEVPAIDDGLQVVWAVGQDTELRREIDRSAVSLSGKAGLGLGWLGDWVMLGTLDRAPLLDALATVVEDIQVPPPAELDSDQRELETFRAVGRLPVFAAAEVRNPAGLVATLAAARAMLNEVAPGVATWENFATHADVPIVRVGISKTTSNADAARYADLIALYYAQAGGTLVVALDQRVLEVMIDRLVDPERRPRGVKADGTQFALEGHVAREHAAWHAIVWALQSQAARGQPNARAFAEAILRGDPSTASDPAKFRALALAYFGGVPVTPEGRFDWTLAPEGVRDPIHGSDVSPVYPDLPVAGATPIGALMDRLSSLRTTLAFDPEPAKLEPPVRSLHSRFELELGAAAY